MYPKTVLLLAIVVLRAGVAFAQDSPSLVQEPRRPVTGIEDDHQGTDVLGAFTDSLKLLLLEHGTRVAFQDKTRRELDGPFWADYRQSIRMPRRWEDTDAWWVNYIGHPIHGAAAGYIWFDHEPNTPAGIGFKQPLVPRARHQQAGKLVRSLCSESCGGSRHDAANERDGPRAGRQDGRGL